ncbi:MAG: hypothetical protein WC058_13605 [Phycisphaeraceae bacterium]
MKHPLRLIVLVMLSLVPVACAPPVYDNPVAVMMNTHESPHLRLAAAEQAEQKLPDDDKRLASLRSLTWERGHPAELRTFAIDSLVRHNEADAKKYLAKSIALVNNWETIQHLLDVAVRRKWVDFTPAIVRCYSRTASAYPDDTKRPEAGALLELNPGRTIDDIVFDVFAHDPQADVNERAAAWTLMNRLVADPEKLLTLLRNVKATDPLVLDLQAAATDLHVTADSKETIAWLQSLRAADHQRFWAQAKQAVASLTDEQRRGLELRHIPLLVHLRAANDPALSMTRAQLLGNATGHIVSQDHFNKSAGYDGGNPDRNQTLAHWQSRLSWGDLLVMHTVIRLMNDPTARAVIFQQADADVKDTGSEYGGLLAWTDANQLIVKPYTPMLRKHNLVYYSSEQLTLDSYFALAHFHLHAQKYENAQWAGPGRGDFERIADTQRYNGILFTCIDPNRINVDFYCHAPGSAASADGICVDLGTITR